MKKLLYIVIFFFGLQLSAQEKEITLKNEVVETACGQCQLDQEGHGCDLAIRYKEKVYFVDGTTIDSHGDAHADHGFCNAISKAKVSGTIVNNRITVTAFELIENPKSKTKTP